MSNILNFQHEKGFMYELNGSVWPECIYIRSYRCVFLIITAHMLTYSARPHTHAHAHTPIRVCVCVCARARTLVHGCESARDRVWVHSEVIRAFWHHVIFLSNVISNPRHTSVILLVYSSCLLLKHEVHYSTRPNLICVLSDTVHNAIV